MAPASPAGPPSSTASAPASPSPSAEPTRTQPSHQSPQVKAASTKLVKTALTLGYPDKTFDDYLERIKPLMTKKGFAGATTTFKVSDKRAKQLDDQRVRGQVMLTSGAEVTTITDQRASTKLTYRLLRQQRVDDRWKTLKTSAQDTVELTLVNDGGRWLVDTAK